MPRCVPGANFLASEKSISCVIRNRPSDCAADHIPPSGLPVSPSSLVVSTSWPSFIKTGTTPVVTFSSNLIFIVRAELTERAGLLQRMRLQKRSPLGCPPVGEKGSLRGLPQSFHRPPSRQAQCEVEHAFL